MLDKSKENFKKVKEYLKKYSGEKSTAECAKDLNICRQTVWKYKKLIDKGETVE